MQLGCAGAKDQRHSERNLDSMTIMLKFSQCTKEASQANDVPGHNTVLYVPRHVGTPNATIPCQATHNNTGKGWVGSSIITKKRSGSDSFTETSSEVKVPSWESHQSWGQTCYVKLEHYRKFTTDLRICPKLLFKLVPLQHCSFPSRFDPVKSLYLKHISGEYSSRKVEGKSLPTSFCLTPKRSQIHTNRRPQSHPHHTHRPKILQPESFTRTLWCPLQVSQTLRKGKGAELFWDFFFFRDFFFFFGWGWFWGCPGSFLGKPRGEMQVRAGFSGHLGVVLGLSRLRSGETSGEMQVSSRFGHEKTASKSKLSRSFLFFVYLSMLMCVCVCDRVCSICFLSVLVLIFHSMYFFLYLQFIYLMCKYIS